MAMIPVPNCGSAGVIKDLSVHELPISAWTDALNIRFLDGYANQFLGQSEVYNTPSVVPQFLQPALVGTARYWLESSANKQYAVTNSGGTAVRTDITHATPRTGVVNNWTGVVFGGIPIQNAGDGKPPMYWDTNLANKFVNLPAWPTNASCKVMRIYKVFLIALGVTKAGVSFPYLVKWSNPSAAGELPTTWDETDPTREAGEFPLVEGLDVIIDGLQLRNSFMIYKESSIWRMDYIGGNDIFSFNKVLGVSGAMNRNCIVEIDGKHLVLTGSDVITHDGQTPISVLDKQSRRWLFQNIDVSEKYRCFVFKNPFLNEAFICFPTIGAANGCDRALVWNYKDGTVSYRQLPNINHADLGMVDNTLGNSWNADPDPWDADLTAWNGPDYSPDTQRVIMASNDQKLYLLDGSASFNGTVPSAFLERRGLSFDADDQVKLVSGIWARITGNVGMTVFIDVAGTDDPYADPVYTETQEHVIGETVHCDFLVEGRYIAIRFRSGTAYQWRLDSYTVDVQTVGMWMGGDNYA